MGPTDQAVQGWRGRLLSNRLHLFWLGWRKMARKTALSCQSHPGVTSNEKVKTTEWRTQPSWQRLSISTPTSSILHTLPWMLYFFWLKEGRLGYVFLHGYFSVSHRRRSFWISSCYNYNLILLVDQGGHFDFDPLSSHLPHPHHHLLFPVYSCSRSWLMFNFFGHLFRRMLYLFVHPLAFFFYLLLVWGFAMDFYANATKTHDFFFNISFIRLISFMVGFSSLFFSCLIAVAVGWIGLDWDLLGVNFGVCVSWGFVPSWWMFDFIGAAQSDYDVGDLWECAG